MSNPGPGFFLGCLHDCWWHSEALKTICRSQEAHYVIETVIIIEHGLSVFGEYEKIAQTAQDGGANMSLSWFLVA